MSDAKKLRNIDDVILFLYIAVVILRFAASHEMNASAVETNVDSN